MDLYTAFMRTADRIEKNPSRCRLAYATVPEYEEDSGCILGWVAYEMGRSFVNSLWSPWSPGSIGKHADGVLPHLGLIHFSDFSTRMIELDEGLSGSCGTKTSWADPRKMAALTRAYAQKYLQPPAQTFDPVLAQRLKSFDKIFAELA